MNPLLRLRFPCVLVALLAAGALLADLAWQKDWTHFFRAYLFAYLFCLGLALGSLCLLLLHNLTGGEWGDQIRPLARAGARTLPLMALLFIPIGLGLSHLYPWAQPEELAQEAVLAHRQAYLNAPFFLIRAAAYFAVWIGLGLAAARGRPIARGLSAAGLILYLWTMTHAGIDWIMSREINFYSTAFGFVVTVGQTLSALALCILLARLLPAPAPAPIRLREPRPPKALIFNDLGNVLLTIVILWIYVTFMEFLVVWMGNTQEDNAWYLQRGLGGNSYSADALAWRIIAALILLLHFFVPFYVLLFRKVKQNRTALPAVAGMLLAAHVLEQYWMVAPSGVTPAPRFDPQWMDGAALAALGGLWFAAFLFLLKRLPPAAADCGAAGRGGGA